MTDEYEYHRLARAEPAKVFFEQLSYSCQREYTRWISEAKKEETRVRRADKAIEMLKSGQKLK